MESTVGGIQPESIGAEDRSGDYTLSWLHQCTQLCSVSHICSVTESEKDLVGWHLGGYLLPRHTNEDTMGEHLGDRMVGIRVNTEYTYQMSGFLFLKKVPTAGPSHCMLTGPQIMTRPSEEGFARGHQRCAHGRTGPRWLLPATSLRGTSCCLPRPSAVLSGAALDDEKPIPCPLCLCFADLFTDLP